MIVVFVCVFVCCFMVDFWLINSIVLRCIVCCAYLFVAIGLFVLMFGLIVRLCLLNVLYCCVCLIVADCLGVVI